MEVYKSVIKCKIFVLNVVWYIYLLLQQNCIKENYLQTNKFYCFLSLSPKAVLPYGVPALPLAALLR